jgi:class 3 adenylate cyclase
MGHTDEVTQNKLKTLTSSSDLLAAYDAAAEALAAAPHDLRLAHRAVLTLARAGATQHARREYLRLGLDQVSDDEDILALGGRLLKDLCLAAAGEQRRRLAALAAAKYAQAYGLQQGYYPGINTATMFLLAGEKAKSAELARAVLKTLKGRAAPRDEDAYYIKATEAEAELLLGNIEASDNALAMAAMFDARNVGARATTMRQFELICAALKFDPIWLDVHRPAPTVFYSGHMFMDATRQPTMTPHIDAVSAAISAAARKIAPGAAFGAVAAGSDIVMAEALIDAGAELHIVLPMREEDFLARSVTPFGPSWQARYDALKAKAASFRLATHGAIADDDTVFTYGTDYAMGLALRNAEMTRTRAIHMAAWDGAPPSGPAGTGADVMRWQAMGRPQQVVAFPQELRSARRLAVTAPPVVAADRYLKAMLFGDVRGYSKLDETHTPAFVAKVMAPLAEAIRALPATPDRIATWGDGIHFIYNTVEDAAEAALTGQECFAELDLAGAGLPTHLALRLGGHVGPVSRIDDPFTHTMNFYGTQITIAARIEPVAVPGTIYVSEPFAAMLALRAGNRFTTDYAGQRELAKGFGTMRLFALRRAIATTRALASAPAPTANG